MTIVIFFLAMVVTYHWPVHQLNIKIAFLCGDLEEEVYMEKPPGFVARGSLVWFVSCANLTMVSNNLLVHGLESSATLFNPLG